MLSEAEGADKTDEELVVLVPNDREAYRFLIRRYESRLLGYVRRLGNLRLEDAEDILQNVFLKAYLNLNSFNQKMLFSSWIYRIAHNETVSHWRRHRTEMQPLPVEDDASATEFFARLSVDADTANEIDRATTAQALREAMSTLDEKHRSILILRYFEDKSYAEISDILRKPLGTVATLLNRAKKALRREIERQSDKQRL